MPSSDGSPATWRDREGVIDFDTAALDSILDSALGKVFSAVQLEIRLGDRAPISRALGLRDPEAGPTPVDSETRFDIASITKLFTAISFMALVEEGLVGLDETVSTVLPEFSGLQPLLPYEDPQKAGAFVELGSGGEEDAGSISFRDLLCHRSGLPAWRPLYRQADPEAGLRLALGTFLSYRRGSRIVYSDIGFVLLGLAMESVTGTGLEEIIASRICRPLGLDATGFSGGHRAALRPEDCAATEFCPWRGRRIRGEVHDENAAFLGGISGHAGLFSTARDLASLGYCLLRGGEPILSQASLAEMTSLQAEEAGVRRGLGFALRSPDPEAVSNPLGTASYGHLGFTGTSLWIDPDRELVVACLTNRVYYGRDPEGIARFRLRLHRTVVEQADRRAEGKSPRVSRS